MTAASRSRTSRGTVKRGAAEAAPREDQRPPKRILLVSIAGAALPAEVIRRTVKLATPEHAKITVLGIARVYGTSLGLPHPGLKPTMGEWEEQRTAVNDGADRLRSRGFEVRVAAAKSRNAPKLIAKWGKARNFDAIVLADPERPRWRRRIEGDLTREIERRCGIRVYAIPTPPLDHRRSRA
jgi:K+-sensing histidine kinase KdpD